MFIRATFRGTWICNAIYANTYLVKSIRTTKRCRPSLHLPYLQFGRWKKLFTSQRFLFDSKFEHKDKKSKKASILPSFSSSFFKRIPFAQHLSKYPVPPTLHRISIRDSRFAGELYLNADKVIIRKDKGHLESKNLLDLWYSRYNGENTCFIPLLIFNKAVLCLLIEKIKHRYSLPTCYIYISFVSIFVSRKINISRELEKSRSYLITFERIFSKNLDWGGRGLKHSNSSFLRIFVFTHIYSSDSKEEILYIYSLSFNRRSRLHLTFERTPFFLIRVFI